MDEARSLDPATVIEAVLREEVRGLGTVDPRRTWGELGLDSFGLLNLRAALEQSLGREIDDEDWIEAVTPSHLLRIAGRARSAASLCEPAGLEIHEDVEIRMPQMALGGLSENWLQKVLGDFHWRLIGEAVGLAPAAICDSFGNRLYPAFTRVRFASTVPLASYAEGETLHFSASLARLGSGFFFSTIDVAGEGDHAVSAELMSSFALRGPAGGNAGLLRGQAAMPDGCRARLLEEMPDFGLVYQRRRRDRDAPRSLLARAPYEILPAYDINGVGLLYCAAYPMIADICDLRARGEPARAVSTSVIERDTCFFANADVVNGLEWRLHEEREEGEGLVSSATIARDDGVVIAWIDTRKVRL